MQKPYISVIIPLYNKELIVERSIKSVLNQSFKDFELIIVDDGSTDGSVSIVESIHDDRIRLFKQENGGPSKAKNTGVLNAKSSWVVFLDADDELLDGALNTYANFIGDHPDADIIDCSLKLKHGTKISIMHHPLNGYSKNPLRDWYLGRIGPGANHSVFKKKILLTNLFNPLLRRFEDADLLDRILKRAIIYSSSIPTAIVNYEYSSASKKRGHIEEDFIGHLSMRGRGFWGRMCVYKLYLENRDLYPEQMRRLYPLWRFRYDLLLINKLANALLR